MRQRLTESASARTFNPIRLTRSNPRRTEKQTNLPEQNFSIFERYVSTANCASLRVRCLKLDLNRYHNRSIPAHASSTCPPPSFPSDRLILSTALLNVPARGDLIAHWTFDEPGGQTAHDAIGQFPGTLLGKATFDPAEGVSRGSIKLNQATQDMVSMGDVVSFKNQDFPLVAWIRLPAGYIQDGFVVSKHQSGYSNGYIMSVNGVGRNRGEAGFYVGNTIWSERQINDGDWHQITGVFQTTNELNLYVDGFWQAELT